MKNFILFNAYFAIKQSNNFNQFQNNNIHLLNIYKTSDSVYKITEAKKVYIFKKMASLLVNNDEIEIIKEISDHVTKDSNKRTIIEPEPKPKPIPKG